MVKICKNINDLILKFVEPPEDYLSFDFHFRLQKSKLKIKLVLHMLSHFRKRIYYCDFVIILAFAWLYMFPVILINYQDSLM